MFTVEVATISVPVPTFEAAATLAIKHVAQRQESAKVRNDAGALLADFSPAADGTISIAATDYGKSYIEEMAR